MTVSDPHLFDNTPAAELSDDQLGERLVGYAGQIAALTARFLDYLAAFDQRHGWSGHGVLSCAHWLSWRAGMNLRTAQDHVRVARALTELSQVREAFTRGELTYSKVRALTRVATPASEPELLDLATSATAGQVERVVRAMRQVERNEERDRNGGDDPAPIESSGRWRWHDDGTLSVTLRFSALDGAAFLSGAVRAEYERNRTTGDPDVPRNAPDTADAPPPRQRDLWRHVPSDIAPAVLAMADTVRTAIDIPVIAPGAEVIVHTHITEGEGSRPDPHLDNGPALTDAEVAEACCGATVSQSTVVDGVRLSWGRDRRIPPRRLVRFIAQRDHHACRHPGCGRTRHLHVHHVKPWFAGGETDPDNLILLCSTHHRALHHGVFGITAHGKQRFTFHSADGALLEPAPPIGTPADWAPDQAVRADATVPINGGKLNLAYTIEVLYRTADYRERRAA